MNLASSILLWKYNFDIFSSFCFFYGSFLCCLISVLWCINWDFSLPLLSNSSPAGKSRLHHCSPAGESLPAPHSLVKEILESPIQSISKNVWVMFLPWVLNLDYFVFLDLRRMSCFKSHSEMGSVHFNSSGCQVPYPATLRTLWFSSWLLSFYPFVHLPLTILWAHFWSFYNVLLIFHCMWILASSFMLSFGQAI